MKEELNCPCCGATLVEICDNVWGRTIRYECSSCIFRCGAGYIDQVIEGMALLRQKRKERIMYTQTTFA